MGARRQDARQLARHVLRRVRRDDAYANLALAGALPRAQRVEERRLLTELVYGVLRQRRLLDHALGQLAHRPLGQIDAEVLDVLRIGAYQLLFLDRVPPHAAVDAAVAAARQIGGARVGGFVNALLRRIDRELLGSGLPRDAVARLAVRCSLPDALARELARQLGAEEAARLAEALLQPAPLVVRANSAKTTAEALAEQLRGAGAEVARGRWAPQALVVRRLESPFSSAGFLAGLWTAQDEAAQLASHLLDPQPGEDVLDACAGVGGKATHLAELLGPRGAGSQLLCVDRSARKLELLRESAQRMGLACRTRQADLRASAALGGQRFHRVLLDAPCSGVGVLRRHPELKWRPGARRGALVRLQRQLLDTAVAALRPAGTLVYAVCTTSEEEGPQQVRWLLGSHRQLRLAPPRRELFSEIDDGGVLRFWPHRHQTDGFFVARFRRAA